MVICFACLGFFLRDWWNLNLQLQLLKKTFVTSKRRAKDVGVCGLQIVLTCFEAKLIDPDPALHDKRGQKSLAYVFQDASLKHLMADAFVIEPPYSGTVSQCIDSRQKQNGSLFTVPILLLLYVIGLSPYYRMISQSELTISFLLVLCF